MIIDEMIEFYRKQENLTRAELQKKMEESSFALARAWRQMNPATAAEVSRFYSKIDYTPDLLRYHNLEDRRETDLDILIEIRGKNRGARVLDFGCGTGVIGFMLKDCIPQLTVELYDLPSHALGFARAFNVHRTRPVEFVNTFDIQHNSYDFIICNDVLEHLPDGLLEETIDLLQSRLASPYSKIFSQIGFYEPHLFPMHFDWSQARCDTLRKVMRWEYWDVNPDFLNLVMKGKLRADGEKTVSAATARQNPAMPVGQPVLKMQECGQAATNTLRPAPVASTVPTASAAPPRIFAAPAPPAPKAGTGRNVAITKRGVLYVGFPCNIKCKFCYYTYHQSKEWHTLDECKRDAALFRKKYDNRIVDITGGEPTIYPHIYDLMDFCNSIDLKPTLITNVQALAREEVAKKFKDHGIYDFLCSVHAVEGTYNDLVQSRNGWKNLTRGIDHINRLEIPWRANCTMTRINMGQLKTIAQWVKEKNGRILNFISFNPFEEWQTKMDIDFQARHSELGPHLIEALEYCDRVGLEANVRYFPFCHMRGHEEKCINFQQLSYDPNEWDFCSWYAPETRAPADKLPDSVRMAATSEEELHKFIAQSQKRGLYVQNGPCLSCANAIICDGFTRQYHSRFGMEEARPYAGPAVSDPAAFVAGRKGSAFVRANAPQPEDRRVPPPAVRPPEGAASLSAGGR